MKLPDGVIDLRKVKTVIGGEGAPAHLTWVIAYNAGVEVGSPHYDAIRLFAASLKAPAGMEQSVMLLPISPIDVSQAPPPPERRRAQTRTKPRAKPRAAKACTKLRAQPRKKPRPKSAAKPVAKSAAKPIAKSAPKARAQRKQPARPTARRARR